MPPEGPDALLAWFGSLSGAPDRVQRLARALLQDDPCQPAGDADRPTWRSALNNDGSPLQVCATYSAGGRRLRIIGDPSARLDDPRGRFARAQAALSTTLRFSRAKGLAPICAATMRRVLPRDESAEALDAGAMWLAADLERGAAMYLNTSWGDDAERWRDAGDWLGAVLPRRGGAAGHVWLLAPYAALASVALEGAGAAAGRAKLYWRMCQAVPLSQLGITPLLDPACRQFLERLVGNREIAATGMVLSAGFSLGDGSLDDGKIDLCAHCIPRSAAHWAEELTGCCAAFGLAPFDLAEGLRDGAGEVAFVGFGVDRHGGRRLNVYLKPAGRH